MRKMVQSTAIAAALLSLGACGDSSDADGDGMSPDCDSAAVREAAHALLYTQIIEVMPGDTSAAERMRDGSTVSLEPKTTRYSAGGGADTECVADMSVAIPAEFQPFFNGADTAIVPVTYTIATKPDGAPALTFTGDEINYLMNDFVSAVKRSGEAAPPDGPQE